MNLFGPFLKTLNIWIKSDIFNFKVNNVDDGMICAGVDQGGDSQYLMLMAMEEVERWMMVVAKLERMQSRKKDEMMAKEEEQGSWMPLNPPSPLFSLALSCRS